MDTGEIIEVEYIPREDEWPAPQEVPQAPLREEPSVPAEPTRR